MEKPNVSVQSRTIEPAKNLNGSESVARGAYPPLNADHKGRRYIFAKNVKIFLLRYQNL